MREKSGQNLQVINNGLVGVMLSKLLKQAVDTSPARVLHHDDLTNHHRLSLATWRFRL